MTSGNLTNCIEKVMETNLFLGKPWHLLGDACVASMRLGFPVHDSHLDIYVLLLLAFPKHLETIIF